MANFCCISCISKFRITYMAQFRGFRCILLILNPSKLPMSVQTHMMLVKLVNPHRKARYSGRDIQSWSLQT